MIGIVVLFAIVALAATSAQPKALAAPSPPPDPGAITGTSIKVEGHWFRRPDSHIDGLPQTDSLGPFQVKAWIEPGSGIASVELRYELHGVYPYSIVQMARAGSTVIGTIPGRPIPQTIGSTALHFYLNAYNADGEFLEIDEISAGPHKDDPYSIRIVKPAPFEGVWRCEFEPMDPKLHIRRQQGTSPTEGDLFLYRVSYTGCKGGIPAPQGMGKLIEPSLIEMIETPSRKYEYDSDDRRLYVSGVPGCGTYIKLGGKP
jgi:hypothetical protein